MSLYRQIDVGVEILFGNLCAKTLTSLKSSLSVHPMRLLSKWEIFGKTAFS